MSLQKKILSVLILIASLSSCKKGNDAAPQPTAADYVGFHTMNLRKYFYGNPQAGFPDSFFSNVTLSIQLVDTNRLRISYSTVFDKQLSFADYLTNDSVIGYEFTGGGIGQTCSFTHNIRTDSIYVSNKNGGLGSGVIHSFRGHK
jgi:hypothetical protein